MTMKKKLIVAIMSLISVAGFTQEYKLAKSTGKLDIKDVNDVKIEGYAGKEVVFTSRNFNQEEDDRAKGLRAISNTGLEDNTGIGLSVVDNNGVIEVRQLKKMDGPDVTIKVPQGMEISYTHTSPHGSDVQLSNVEGAVEITTVHNDVRLDKMTGSVKVKTAHGDVDATFSGSIKNPISISSTHGHVDVALPSSASANVKLNTSWGEIFVDPTLKFGIEKSGDLVKYNDKLSAKINGGGVEVSLSSTHDNVYLRKSN